MNMTKRILVLVVLTALIAPMAQAAQGWYNLSITRVGARDSEVFIRVTSSDSSFSGDREVYLSTNTTIANRILAVVLTAVSNGSDITARIDPDDSSYRCTQVLLAN